MFVFMVKVALVKLYLNEIQKTQSGRSWSNWRLQDSEFKYRQINT